MIPKIVPTDVRSRDSQVGSADTNEKRPNAFLPLTSVTFVYPEAKSEVDGIQDYISSLRAELEAGGVATSEDRPSRRTSTLFRTFWQLPRRGNVILQYQPFAWGPSGFAPWLPWLVLMARIVRRVDIVLMVHETYIRPSSFRTFVISGWQRLQLAALCPLARRRFASCDYYVAQVTSMRFRGCVRLPVSSPLPAVSRNEGSAIEGDNSEFVIATILTDHPSQLIGHALAAAEGIARDRPDHDVRFLVLGKSRVSLQTQVSNLTIERPGYLAARALAERARGADLFLLPYSDGLTARRTTLMIALQAAVPVVSTSMPYSDEDLVASDAVRAVALPASVNDFARAAMAVAADQRMLKTRGSAGRALFDQSYSWSIIASQLLSALRTY